MLVTYLDSHNGQFICHSPEFEVRGAFVSRYQSAIIKKTFVETYQGGGPKSRHLGPSVVLLLVSLAWSHSIYNSMHQKHAKLKSGC